jgi:adenylate cyclase
MCGFYFAEKDQSTTHKYLMVKKWLLSPWTALLTLSVVVSIRTADPAFVESIRLRYFDSVIVSAPVVPSTQVHVVNIDDTAVEQRGQFPFPRGQYAEIIQDLYQRNAGLVVFNVFMPDRDRAGQDSLLSRTLQQHPVVLPHLATNDPVRTGTVPFRPGVSVIGSGDPGIPYRAIQPNERSLNETAAGIGIANTVPEVDGVVRRIPMVASVAGQLYPSISLETLRVAAGDPSFQIKINGGIIEAVRIPKFGKIPTDSYGRIWVDWASQPAQHSLAALPKDFQGGIVVVGVTARGLNNPVATARGEVYPHSLQASLLTTVAEGRNIVRADWAEGAEILAITLGGVLLLFLTRWTYVGMVSTFVLVGGSVAASWYAFTSHLWLFDATAFAVGTVLVALHAYGVKFVSEFLQKQQIKKQFGTYLSPAMVEKLQKNPALLTLGGESRELSIMFTDVRGFTTISEHYGRDVQGLTQIMNRYMTAMTAKILENKGTLDKYIGDAQMAFWNAPLDDAAHAKNAVRTGLEMMGSLDAFNQKIMAEDVPPFGMGLGINTATVVVGNMGSDQRFDYTCLGDGVNLASRLEGQSKPYGVKIVLGPLTAQQVQDEYFVLELDTIAVKGKTEGVNIFTVLQTQNHDTSEWNSAKEVHDLMLSCYRKQQWTSARKFTQDLVGEFDGQMDLYYNMWLERIEEMSHKTLPEDWSGTYVATSK